jgi:hypothetical protein
LTDCIVFRACSDAVSTTAVCDSNDSVLELELRTPTVFTASVSEQPLDVVKVDSEGGQEEELAGVGAQFSS